MSFCSISFIIIILPLSHFYCFPDIMPRKYKRKLTARRYGYLDENMKKAIVEVKENGLSVRKAAMMHGLNRTTLHNHIVDKHSGKVGKPTCLTHLEESMLVHALQKLGEWGFGIDRADVCSIVVDYLKETHREHIFKNGKPGVEWMYGFEERWKDQLTRRVGQPLPANRAYACNKAVVDDFFEKLTTTMNRLNLMDKPQNIFNVDESGFQTDIGSQKMFCKRGLKNPHKTVATSTKTMYTVQVCCSANGIFLPLYVVYKGKHLYSTWCNGGPEKTRYNCSDSGWMESVQFVEWFEKIFIPETKHLDGNKLLIFDGHSSHISSTVVTMAIENNIELLCLPAHTSSILQPLDVGVFKSVKSAWRKCLKSFYEESRFDNVDKIRFPKLLDKLVSSEAFSRVNAIHGFETCGIFPLNRNKITADKIATSEPLTSASTNDNAPSSSQTRNSSSQPSSSAVPSPSTSLSINSSPTSALTPRKGLEMALLSHFRQNITPTGRLNRHFKFFIIKFDDN